MIVDAFQWHKVNWLQKVFTRVITKGRRQITVLQSLPILSKVLILILGTIMIPVILALTLSNLLALVFAIPGIFMCIRWVAMIGVPDSRAGDIKIPTFYAERESVGEGVAFYICIPVVGVVFGGIHCVGWFFNFPSSTEAMLWRVSSAVLTVVAFLSPIIVSFLAILFETREYFVGAVSAIFILVYVVSRLLLIVEAFITLRHLTPGMLALVKWTSFLPHIWSQTSTVLLLVHRISSYPFHDHFSSKYPAIIGIRYRMFLGYLRRGEKFSLNQKCDTISNLEKIFNISDKSMYFRRQLSCQSHRLSLYQLGWTTWYPFLAVRGLLNDFKLFCRSSPDLTKLNPCAFFRTKR